jgi:hypothetical protein
MAYNAANLSVLAYANGFTLWHYTTRDRAADAEAVGYFNKAAELLRVNDIIFANVDTGSTPAAGMFLVKSIVNGVVDVSNMTSLNNT